ncbi:MAG: HAD family hydrolase [Verrucomicrobiota bacterium]|nr:HAD family hydrolase [Verrucomicrobiota bacterium]
MANHAVFLDRDGTLIVDKVYLGDPAGVELMPGTHEALLKLVKAGFKLFIVSNQSGVGRKLFTLEQMHKTNQRMVELMPGVSFTEVYCCTCLPDDPKCNCRKPSPKFLFQAEDKYLVNLRKSYFIGDRESDVECGLNGGCISVLLLTGHGKESQPKLAGKKYHTSANLPAAVDWIISNV